MQDISKVEIAPQIFLYHTENKDDDLFELSYVYPVGTNSVRELKFAADYLNYLGAGTFSGRELKEEFYKSGCSFSTSVYQEEIHLKLSGLRSNLSRGLELLELLLKDSRSNEEALQGLKEDYLKQREDMKLSKDKIMWSALYNYAKYGSDSPFLDRMDGKKVTALTSSRLSAIIKQLAEMKHEIYCYGPGSVQETAKTVKAAHDLPRNPQQPAIAHQYKTLAQQENRFYIVDYKMKQAEICLLSRDEKYNSSNSGFSRLFNNYYGSSWSSIVFQTLREAKALAYSASVWYNTPWKKNDYHYVQSYIGTQVDKVPEAVEGLLELLNGTMPESEISFASSRQAIKKGMESECFYGTKLFSMYQSAVKKGLAHDIRKEAYKEVEKAGIEDIRRFHKEHISGHHFTGIIVADVEKLDLEALKQFGKVEILSLEEVFGY